MSDDQGPKIKALREALGLTQAQVTSRLGPPEHADNWVLRAEKPDGAKGLNQLTSDAAKAQMARGLGLSLNDFKAYLSGKLSRDAALARARAAASSGASGDERSDASNVDAQLAESGSSLERALGFAFDPRVHTLSDLRAVQDTLGAESYQWQRPEADLVAAARTWLTAAAQLRREGLRVTAVALLDRVTFGRDDRARAAAAAHGAELEAQADEELEAQGLIKLDAEGIAKARAAALKGAGKGQG